MKALRLIDWKTDPELVEVPKPDTGSRRGCRQDLRRGRVTPTCT